MIEDSDFFAELSSNGYARVNGNSRSVQLFKRHPDIRFNIFRFGSGVGSNIGKSGRIKYSSLKLFGKRFVYYVLDCEEAKKEFGEHLADLFLEKNPKPDPYMRRVFTRLLHNYHGLHSRLCYKKELTDNLILF